MQRLTAEDPAAIGPYQLIARIGHGGMGVVYLAEPESGENVAVKVLRPELARDPAFLARFRREVGICQRVSGANCARYVAADADAAPPWLATEYVAGPTLAEYVDSRGPVSGSMLTALAAGIAEGLQAIHRVGLVHRDLKPANVVLSSDGPRLIDFGIAHHADITSLTAPGAVVGSPGWMAPEQLLGDQIGSAADVWAWGATVAFAANGRPPFGTGPAPEVAQRILSGLPDLAGVPDTLVERVRAALDPDPTARPPVTDLVSSPAEAADPDGVATVIADNRLRPNDTRVLPVAPRRAIGKHWLIPILAGSALAALVLVVVNVLQPGAAPTGQPSSASSTTSEPSSRSIDPWAMAHFRPSGYEPTIASTFRAFSGQPSYIPDFPLTMNGCASRAMRTHWRSLGQQVTSGKVDYSDTPEAATEADATGLTTATSGWIDTGGCEQPVFFVSAAGGSTLVDITFETRIFEAAP